MKRHYRRIVYGSVLASALCWFTLALTDDGKVGAETCAACHEEVVAAFGKTAHAIAPGWDAETLFPFPFHAEYQPGYSPNSSVSSC